MLDLVLFLTLAAGLMIGYVIIGYPLLVIALSKMVRRVRIESTEKPTVSLFVSCFNEEAVLPQKIDNCLAIDYPRDSLEFIFVSDGSTDDTEELVRARAADGIKLVTQERAGKTLGLNKAVPTSNGEILVFSDANAMYKPDAIAKLVENFADDKVGYAVGAALYADVDSSAGASESSYWDYELKLKIAESEVNSVVGGDGAIYAIRRELFAPLDAEDINDFVTPLQIIAKGYRGVFDPEAIAFEDAAGTFDKESRRKRRIVNRSLSGLLKVKACLYPWATGLFSWQVWSHKFLRWLIPYFLLIFAMGSIVLSIAGHWWFTPVVIGLAVGYWLYLAAELHSDKQRMPTLLSSVYYFVIVNVSTALGVYDALRGKTQITWSSPRNDNAGQTSASRLGWHVPFVGASIAIAAYNGYQLLAQLV
ncbi:MAG: glycosyltransferase family 2 protein [Pseudomonadota bacterium]